MQGENCKQWPRSTAAASSQAPEDRRASNSRRHVRPVARQRAPKNHSHTFGDVRVCVFGSDDE